MTFFVFDA